MNLIWREACGGSGTCVQTAAWRKACAALPGAAWRNLLTTLKELP